MNSDWIAQYIGIPYKSKGSDETGVDCYGLVKMVYLQQLCIVLPDGTDRYSDSDNRESVNQAIEKNHDKWSRVVIPKPFDVVLILMSGYPIHIGILCPHYKVLHSLQGRNTCMERLDSKIWENRIEGFYKWDCK